MCVCRLPFRDAPAGKQEHRRWLVRIGRGEYVWPAPLLESEPGGSGDEMKNKGLVRCQGARRVVGRLLVRDLVHRATVCECWTDEWMYGEPRAGQSILIHNSIVTRCYSYVFMVLCYSFFYMRLLDEDRINVVQGRGCREDVVNLGAGYAIIGGTCVLVDRGCGWTSV